MPTSRPYAGVAGDERQAARRSKLLQAGLDLLAEGGPAALTVTGVCKRAGLTTRYFYEHFVNRDALLQAIIDAETDLMIAVAYEATAGAAGTPAERGAAGVRALLDALEADPRAVRITREQGDDEVVLRMRAEITARLTAAFVENAALVWPEHTDHPERIELAGALVIGGVMQLIVGWLQDKGTIDREDLIRIAAEFTITTGNVVLAG